MSHLKKIFAGTGLIVVLFAAAPTAQAGTPASSAVSARAGVACPSMYYWDVVDNGCVQRASGMPQPIVS